jgi:adenylate cyclase, class 2
MLYPLSYAPASLIIALIVATTVIAATAGVSSSLMARANSYIENEVKIRCSGTPVEARAQIETRGYRQAAPRVLESDRLFDRVGSLRGAGQLLRLRRSGDRSLVTYKGPVQPQRHKSREEIEFDVSDPGAFTKMLERLGFEPAFGYEKYRTKFAAEGEPGFITLDETPIGIFLELEGPPDWVDATAGRLGFTPAEYSTASYAKLYEEYCQSHPGAPSDMLFPESHLSRTPGKDS